MIVIGAAAFAVLMPAAVVQAQSRPSAGGPPKRPRFEVVSIKQCKVRDATGGAGKKGGGGWIHWDLGRLTEECQTAFNLIRDAYLAYPDGKPWRVGAVTDYGANDPDEPPCTGCGDGLPPVSNRQFKLPLKGSPPWLNSDRYTVEAKAAAPESMPMMRGPMMQALLEDQFKLKVHRETREVPVYELTIAKRGPRLRTTKEGSCVPIGRWQPPAVLPSPEHPPPASQMECGHPFPSASGLDFNGTTIANLCRLLSGWADRDVIDKTGLTGMFDFQFDIEVEPPADIAAMFLSTINALAKMGLKVTAGKATDQFLVIDHVERPSGN